jgi:hypothetical protein
MEAIALLLVQSCTCANFKPAERAVQGGNRRHGRRSVSPGEHNVARAKLNFAAMAFPALGARKKR